tara:strand:- start:187 stop:738 length:552 start_codon:yes stop_codon:yes gene_type:complete
MDNNINIDSPLSNLTDNISSISDTSMSETTEHTSSIFKIILLSIILLALGTNVLLFVFEKTDIVSKFMSEGLVGIIRSVQKIFSTSINPNHKEKSQRGVNSYKQNERLNKAINKPGLIPKNNPKPDMSTESSVQNPNNVEWCYIGKDRTYRSCARINKGDNCMSGDIFPTKDICINPSLRHNV